MADKVSRFIFPVKSGDTVTDKEFELPGGSSFDGDYNSLTNKPTLGTAAAKDVPSSGNASSSQVVMGNDSRLSDSRNAKDVPAWAKASTKPTYTASEVGAIATTTKGTANGVAELDANGKVPSSQLPSFVDDTIEGYLYNSKWYKESAHTTEIAGETGKIYVDLSTNKTYRWSGSAFVEISASLALGETSSTAYRGDRGKTAYDHSQSTHARTDATKTEASSTNGNIKINGTETNVYTHPGSGTNPHGTTKSDVGLSNVGNFKAVSTVASQGLSDTEKANARTNIGAGTSSFSGSYNDLTDKPTIPTVNNATLTIQKNGTTVKTFTANASSNVTANITVPTKVSELTNDSGYTTNTGTVTKVSTGAGLTGGDITTSGTVKANLKSETKSTLTASSKGSTANREYAVGLDANGNLSVNVPWTDNNTKNTAGATDSSSKLFIIGATSQGDNPQTYSQDTAYVGTDGCLYSGGKKTLTALPSHNHDDRYYTETEVDEKLSKTEVLISNSSDAFSSSKPYAVGDLCIYNNVLYRCITACSAGSWATNQSCFTADTLVNVVDSVNKTKIASISTIISGANFDYMSLIRKGKTIFAHGFIHLPNASASNVLGQINDSSFYPIVNMYIAIFNTNAQNASVVIFRPDGKITCGDNPIVAAYYTVVGSYYIN